MNLPMPRRRQMQARGRREEAPELKRTKAPKNEV